MTDKRIFLAVPYEDREAARAAGARWDATLKVWYVGAQADQRRIARWLRGEGEPPLAPRDEFIATMTAHGLLAIDRHPIADGRNHRVPVEGDKLSPQGRYTRPSGRYALHLDGHPAGYVRNFRTGLYASWKSTGFRLPPHEMAALRADIVEREKAHALEQAEMIEAAARRAQARTATLIPADHPTSYMVMKGIRPTRGALTDAAGLITFLPAIDVTGKQWTIQTIKGDGTKLFQKGSRKEGTFHIVDGDLASLERVAALVMAEGYATAVIVTDAIRQPTIAAFDAGNLLPVAEALRERFPDRPILIAGDDDYGVELKEGHNPGREKAAFAADAVTGNAVFPQFAAGEREQDPRGFTDFHDLATRSRLGREAAEAQLQHALAELLGSVGGKLKEGAMSDEQEPLEQERRREPPPAASKPLTSAPEIADRDDQRAANVIAAGRAPTSEESPRSDREGEPTHSDPSRERGDVPDAIAARYRVETAGRRHHDYFESHTAETPAFRDRGDRLVTELESAAVIADLVAIAEHRGWASISVSGTQEFRRETWLRAQTAGLEVSGYAPSQRDRQEASARATAAPRTEREGSTDRALPSGAAEPQAKVYLSVPFSEKDEARAAGAKWDRGARSWYVEETGRDAVSRWIPDADHARADSMIGRDRAAIDQMRTIEAVVTSTLGDDPVKARRVIDAGRDALAAKVERGEPIASPRLSSDPQRVDRLDRHTAEQPIVSRKPRERSR